MASEALPSHTPVLIVGGGPIGLALAGDLGWRGVACCLVEQNDGTIEHPRANAENARTMEFFRRWGIADAVRRAGTPPDYPHRVVYLTGFAGYEIACLERPSHGGSERSAISPERPQRCNQLFLDPILRDFAASFGSVALRYRCRFESFVPSEHGVTATVLDLATGDRHQIEADYLIACCGGHSSIRRQLGIEMRGDPFMEYNLDFFFRVPELWSYHDKGKAALYFFIDAAGLWRILVQIDGRELWRLSLRGKELYDAAEKVDPHRILRDIFGRDVPYEITSTARWIARDLVADRYGTGHVFLAGDAAHQNTPTGGFGLNTGMGDSVDLGWKLAAVLEGWGGAHLLDSYDAERRPVAIRNVSQAADNLRGDQALQPHPAIAEDSPDGARARAAMRAALLEEKRRMFLTDGTALGYRYDRSPICCDDGSPALADTISEYRPTSRPGARAPHAWLPDGSSILDLFGRGFTLLQLGPEAPDGAVLESAFSARGVPWTSVAVADPECCRLYERKLVVVRPDGHVAWRGDTLPDDPLAVVDRVRGAASAKI